jgi:flagellar hook protein FlgE
MNFKKELEKIKETEMFIYNEAKFQDNTIEKEKKKAKKKELEALTYLMLYLNQLFYSSIAIVVLVLFSDNISLNIFIDKNVVNQNIEIMLSVSYLLLSSMQIFKFWKNKFNQDQVKEKDLALVMKMSLAVFICIGLTFFIVPSFTILAFIFLFSLTLFFQKNSEKKGAWNEHDKMLKENKRIEKVAVAYENKKALVDKLKEDLKLQMKFVDYGEKQSKKINWKGKNLYFKVFNEVFPEVNNSDKEDLFLILEEEKKEEEILCTS